jgi:DivIVA domain-containing protein
MTMNDAERGDPVVNGDGVRNIKFRRGVYDAAQVNALLDRVAAELDAGRPAGPLIANATFQRRLRGYDTGGVDWFLEQLRRREDPAEADRMNADPWRDLAADPYCIRREPGELAGRIAAPSKQACADAWRDFGQQPGTQLRGVQTGALRGELRTAERHPIVTVRRGWRSATVTVGGRTFTWRRVARSSRPGIAETISRDRPVAAAHMLERPADYQDPLRKQLLDETGIPILYTAGTHIDRSAGGFIKFPGQRWLRFPVRGTSRADAIMTAIDQAGNKVARYRLAPYETGLRKATEITVHPGQQLTDELALAITASAPWLRSYFMSGGGG